MPSPTHPFVAASTFSVLAPAILALLGALAVTLIAPVVQTYLQARARYDTAIAAVARQQASKQGRVALQLDPDLLRATDPSQVATVEHELSTEGYRVYLEAATDARVALAALHPWSPDLRKFWDKPGVLEFEDTEQITAILVDRRKRPNKRYESGSA